VYIGAIPTPAATESRQEFTATANQTVFNTTGGTVGYCDCFLNGVKLANSDFSFDGADVTLTTGAAAGDVLAVVMRQADNALVALPIKDSQGNNVLSEANSVVSIGSGVQFPTGSSISGQIGGGHILQVQQKIKTDTFSTTNTTGFHTITGYNVQITPSASSNKVIVLVALHIGENQDAFPLFKMYRNSTELQTGTVISPGLAGMFAKVSTQNSSRDQYLLEPVNFQFIDSPNTTSAVTYSVKVRPMSTNNRTVYVNRGQTIGDANQATAISTITAMEISA
jgi:hypothetical protein